MFQQMGWLEKGKVKKDCVRVSGCVKQNHHCEQQAEIAFDCGAGGDGSAAIPEAAQELVARLSEADKLRLR
jgi:hypothetical protein